MKRAIAGVCAAVILAGAAYGVNFSLTVNVVGGGRVDPVSGSFAAGSVVTIQAWPDDGNWVQGVLELGSQTG